ncbi:MAG TPA: response regulator, partial [Vicinamibacterales bacterium]|nr:response regulator [Vicinamibacterales bacterium]
MSVPILTLPLRTEADLVAVRQRSRQLAELLGFDAGDQTRIATALSEIARQAIEDGGGDAEFQVEGRTPPQILTALVTSRPAARREARSSSPQVSASGVSGLVAARRLVDHFSTEERPDGSTQILLRKVFPRHAALLSRVALTRIGDQVAALRQESAVSELQRQNQELIRALDALRERQEELVRVNGELEDTNRGVVALFAELDEKADHLRRADEMKSRFLSNMSHEFRTPLNAIRGLSNLLLEHADGDLNSEQEHQVSLITRAARELAELVDDLLDLAKVEAGKTVVRPVEFDVRNLLAALRGMLRPLLLSSSVALVFDELDDPPPVFSDEGKVSQILRNFISNALKFTESGEVRVSVRPTPDGQRVLFTVQDTGIGIAPEDQEAIFREFTQIENPLQQKTKGTGLGLPLSRKLAELLGGRILLRSEVGKGSAFTLDIPVRYHPADEEEPVPPPPREGTGAPAVLVVEDSPEMLLIYDRYLKEGRYELLRATTLARARHLLTRRRVQAIVLDILLRGEDTWTFLAELKNNPETAGIPVVVITQIDDRQKVLALGADAFCRKPPDRQWLAETLQRLIARASGRRALVVDDEEASRYLWARLLLDVGWQALEADSGERGIELARIEKPDVVLVDLRMPPPDGLAVWDALKADERTSAIPVILMSSKVLEDVEARAIGARGAPFLSKSLSVVEARRALTALLGSLPAVGQGANDIQAGDP